ncbi:BTB/POZ domain-containing protein 6 [Chionoecetes opilio]|uniref:BTB/POZ domain-containing protein 6 n=1 Tax=Chionoecetes opilio TaxID=41210 RepID=A0A8J5CNX4_CHIOP|nr:BTB/POZ domain-containing protein 6 [Chionoecetes opilio]
MKPALRTKLCKQKKRRKEREKEDEEMESALKETAHNLFENEDKSDIVFLVGEEGLKERMPAHSWILSARNHFFRAMFHQTWADRHKNVYNIPNDPKGFQNLLKWLYRQECGFQSLDSALTTLDVAIQYLCPELADLCAAYLSQHLNDANVLRVMQQVYRYCPMPYAAPPSAPPLEELEGRTQEALRSMVQDLGDEGDFRDPTECCGDLYNECLEILDRATSSVLASEGLEELDRDALEVILKRQTLGVREEVEVVEAVVSSAAKFLDKGEVEYIRAEVSGKQGKGAPPPPYAMAPHVQLMATARGCVALPAALQEAPPASKKKCGNKKKYTKKELLLDIVSFLAIIFD